MFDRRLLAMVTKARGYIVGVVACNLVSLAAYVVFLLALASLLARLLGPAYADAPAAFTLFAAVSEPGLLGLAAAGAVLRFVFDALARYLGSKAGSNGVATVRQALYDKLVELGPSYREHIATSQAAQLCSEGVQKLDAYLGAYVPQFFYALMAPLCLFVLMLSVNVVVAVVLLVCVPLIPAAIMAVMKVAKHAMGQYWDSYVDLGGEFLEAVRGLTTLKAYGADAAKQAELYERADAFRRQTVKLLTMQLNSVTIMDFFTYGGAALAIVVALFQCAAGQLTAVQTLFVALVAVEFFMPMRKLGSYFHTGMGAAPVIDEVFELLDAENGASHCDADSDLDGAPAAADAFYEGSPTAASGEDRPSPDRDDGSHNGLPLQGGAVTPNGVTEGVNTSGPAQPDPYMVTFTGVGYTYHSSPRLAKDAVRPAAAPYAGTPTTASDEDRPSSVRDDGSHNGLPLQGGAVTPNGVTEGVTHPEQRSPEGRGTSPNDPAQNAPNPVIPSSVRPKAEARREESLIGASRSDVPPSPALANVDFAVEPGSFIGITGPSGSGKSTLLSILAGNLHGYTGSATLGGVELADIDPAELHKIVTYVPSSGYVFKGTFRTNLMMGNPDVSDYTMWNTLNRCHLDDIVLNLGGLDAPVEEGGANLSGGQRQRLCLARALLRDTPIYLFDEVTSNIDAESENDIMAAIQELAFFKTVVVASHRLSALQWADTIYVMNDGQMVQSGKHSTLMIQGGIYAGMWEQQRHLEAFAHEAKQASLPLTGVDGEVELDVPEGMRKALAAMPPHIATVALQSMRGARIKRLTEAGGGNLPAGHPADIPLPGAGIESDLPAEDGASLCDASNEGSLTTASASPSPVRDDEDSQPRHPEQRSAVFPSASSKDPSQNASRSDAQTSTASIFLGLLRLGAGLGPTVARGALLGALSYAAGIGLVVFALLGLLGIVGAEPALPLPAACVGAVVCGVVRGVFHYAERLTAHDGTFRTLALIRDRVFEHMRALAPARLEARDAGDLISLLTSDIDLLEVLYAHTLTALVQALLVCLGVVVALAFASPALALAAALGYVFAGVVLPQISARIMSEPGAKLRERSVKFESFILESLRGLPELLGFDCAQLRADELGGRMGVMAKGARSVARRSAVLGSCGGLLQLICVVAASALAAGQVACGQLAAGTALLGVATLLVSFPAVLSVAQLATSLHQTMAAGGRVLSFLSEESVTPEVTDGADLHEFTGAELSGVHFSYGSGTVLNGVDFRLEPGSIIHVAGRSGVGKSTLVKLLMRFWDVDGGVARVSGVDVRKVNSASLRALECYVGQDTHLFAGTIRSNVSIARPGASDTELLAACEKASLGPLIARLPHGLDTQVGELGEGLSAGERQRIGFARAFLSDAPLLLLDEPTSNLDCLNEAMVLQALADNSEGKTILLVSHRPTASAIADETLVLRR